MKSKIEWYREVLELEPYSKVFFPLARLLVDMEKYEEALATLEQGLVRHPEFVEAKLLQAEVLQHLGRDQDLERLIQGVSEAMAEYPVFWEAWARQLEDEDEGRDPAVAMRFLAAWFAGHKFNWAQIIQTGLQTLLGEEQELPPLPGALQQAAAMAAADVASVAQPETQQEEPPREQEPAHEPESEPGEEAGEEAGIHPAGGESRQHVQEAEAGQSVTQEPEAAAEPTPLPEAGGAEFVEEEEFVDDGPVAQKSLRSFEQALAETELEPEDTEGPAALVEEAEEACDEREPLPEEDGDASAAASEDSPDEQDVDDEEEGEEETFSLRTRTMADLLAEQGDYEGALDIYRELVAMAPGGEARQELEDLVEQMRRLAGEKPKGNGGRNRKSGAKTVKSPSSGLKGKTKLINALESLAQRLEAKAAR